MGLTISTDSLEGGQAVLNTIGDLVRGGMQVALVKITFDSSYPTGGEAIDLSNYFTSVEAMVCMPFALTYYGVYDKTNSKILAYTRSTDAEVSNATDLSAVSMWFFVLGTR